MKITQTALLALQLQWLGLQAIDTPSCESDIGAHCLGEDADMSQQGIQSCLSSLGAGDRSELCNQYLSIIDACYKELGAGGICEADHKEGDTMPCLMQRTAPENLSGACRLSLPVEEVKTGIKDTFWKNGKRLLEDDEIAELDDNDLDTYERWVKKKNKKKKSSHGKDKDYAILKMKQEKAKQKLSKEIVSSLTADAERLTEEGKSNSDLKDMLTKKVKRAVKKAKKEGADVGEFEKSEVKDLVKKIIKSAKSGKEEL